MDHLAAELACMRGLMGMTLWCSGYHVSWFSIAVRRRMESVIGLLTQVINYLLRFRLGFPVPTCLS